MRGLIRRVARIGVAAAGASALAAGMVAASPGAPGAAAATTLTAAEAALPSNAAADPAASVLSVWCASAGNCTAVGGYSDTSGNGQALLLTETSGTWAATEAPLPAGAADSAGLDWMSCPSAGNCTAVGVYTDASGHYEDLLLTEASGTWSAADPPPLPANAVSQYGDLSAVSCASAGNCVVIGTYDAGSGVSPGLLLTETSGNWSAAEAPLPADAAASPVLSLYSASCVPAGDCTVAGYYRDSSGSPQGLLLTETSGAWTAARAPLPANGVAASLRSLSCASAGNCTAGGYYNDNPGNTLGLVLTETSGTWAAAEAPLPAGAGANPAGQVSTVSCPSAGNCTAAGRYLDNSGNLQYLLLTQASGTWAAAEPAMPAGAAVNPVSGFFRPLSVSCASAGNCTAAGSYRDSSGNTQALMLTQTSGTWAAGAEAPVPADAGANPQAGLPSVSCTSAGNCTAGGYYFSSSGNGTRGLLVSQTAAAAQPTATTLASSPSPSASGHPVTYTATVSPVPDAGTVTFTDGTTAIAGCGARPVSTSTGQATCQTAPGTAGSHSITAAFSGSGSFAPSTSAPLTQVVTSTQCPTLAGCNLSGLNLAGADLSGANLSGANLKGANLSGADLSGANLSGTNLNSANLSGANLNGADVAGANFAKVTWSATTCPDGTSSNADGGTCAGHL